MDRILLQDENKCQNQVIPSIFREYETIRDIKVDYIPEHIER
jgi:hypothetical protein